MRHLIKLYEDFRRAVELSQRSGKKGFSLIELLVVIAIIAILAAIAIPQYNKYRANAMLSNVQSLTKSIADDALALATTSAQNPNANCRYADSVTVYTENQTNPSDSSYTAPSSPEDCSGGSTCYLVALGKDGSTVCDFNTIEVPPWVKTLSSGLKIKIYGTNATISSGNVTVLSIYSVTADKKFGCIYYPQNDTMTDYNSTYVCKTF